MRNRRHEEAPAASDPSHPPVANEGVRAVRRALELMGHFDPAHVTRTLAELDQLSPTIPKTTIVRMLATLETAGLLSVRGDGVVQVGLGLLRWATLAECAWQVPVQETLDALASEFGDTVQLQWRNKQESRTLVAQAVGPQELRYEGAINAQYDLWRGAAAEVMLERDSLESLKQVARSSGGAIEPKQLARKAKAAAARGYAATTGVREQGVAGLAVPVRDTSGTPVAALVLVGPIARIEPQFESASETLRAAATQVEDRLRDAGTLP